MYVTQLVICCAVKIAALERKQNADENQNIRKNVASMLVPCYIVERRFAERTVTGEPALADQLIGFSIGFCLDSKSDLNLCKLNRLMISLSVFFGGSLALWQDQQPLRKMLELVEDLKKIIRFGTCDKLA